MEKALVVGGGGREHALAWKLAKEFDQIYCAPGNAGTGLIGNCRNVHIPATDITGLADFAEMERIDLTVIGPELPLSMGIVDEFNKKGLKFLGRPKMQPGWKAAKPSPRSIAACMVFLRLIMQSVIILLMLYLIIQYFPMKRSSPRSTAWREERV